MLASENIKVLWLCTFSNEEKCSHLKLWKTCKGEYGQWIPNLLQAFEGDEQLDLHVVSSDNFMVEKYQSWTRRDITYHCFKSGMPLVGRNWPMRFPVDHMTRFWLNRHRIRRIVERVRPDVIHLFGVENPQYGAAVLDLLEHYPVLVTIQGFIHRERTFHDDFFTRIRCRYEERLLKACRHFSGDYDSEQVVKSFNQNITYRHLYFPVNETLIAQTPQSEKIYDILYVGGLTVQKGIFDYLTVLQNLVQEFPDIQAAIVGSPQSNPAVVARITEQRLDGNVVWIGRFPSQEGLFRVFRQSRLLLTPTYNDAFPSTIREGMLLGTPAVSYRTGGIPWANRDGHENVVLVDQGDTEGMARKVASLFRDIAAYDNLAQRARTFAGQEFSLKHNAGVIRKAYQDVRTQI